MKREKQGEKPAVRKRVRGGVIVTLLLLAALIVTIVAAFQIYHRSLEKKLNTYTEANLKEISDESSERISMQVGEYFHELQILSNVIFSDDSMDTDALKELLSRYENFGAVAALDFIDTNGQELLHSGLTDELGESGFIQAAMDGMDSISELFEYNGEKSLAFAYQLNGKIHGLLVSCYPLSAFEGLSSDSIFSKKTSTFIIQGDGTIISRSKGELTEETFFDILQGTEKSGDYVFKKLKKDIENGESGIASYGSGAKKRYITYRRVADGEWYSVSIVSASLIEPYGQYINSIGIYLSITIILAFSIFILYIFLRYIWNVRKWYYGYRKVLKERKNAGD